MTVQHSNMPRPIALAGCTVVRPEPDIELVIADAAMRSFPARESESFGVCVKRGRAHEVVADGRRVEYPADAISIRPPGCVWSVADTGATAFSSVDLGPSRLPESLSLGRMVFRPSSTLPGFEAMMRAWAEGTREDASELIAEIVTRLHAHGAIDARELDDVAPHATVAAARAQLAERVDTCPTLDELAREVGANKFVLLRQFKQELGVTPREYAVLLRLARAREDLARGRAIVEVASRWGFADQAHLTRQFRAAYGLTPGAYARAVRRSIHVRKRESPSV